MIRISGPAVALYSDSSETAKDLNSIIKALVLKDSTLWGPNSEAASRLNWIDLPTASRNLLPELDALGAWARSNHLSNVILCGMGGSSLAPEVIAKSYLKELKILDTTDPDQIHAAIPQNLINTVVVVASKSGTTIETSSQLALFEELFRKTNLDPKNHLVIVTDPGSRLDSNSRANGYKVINADPNVGGRYSALSAFGLVATALLGIDPSVLIDDAASAMKEFSNADSTVIKVATLLCEQVSQNFALFDSGSKVPGLSDWIEQLIAESTGKNKKGRLPIVIENQSSVVGGRAIRIGFAGEPDLLVEGTLGEQFIFWEFVTALLGRALKVDPFDQPNVTEAKEKTDQILAEWEENPIPPLMPIFEDEDLQIFSVQKSTSLISSLSQFCEASFEYLAVMAYLNREDDSEILKLRELIAIKVQRGTTFGWGPRFLHSTGQFHKGGQQNGAFIQITGENKVDIELPGNSMSFHKLLMAQALGDGETLTARNLPLLRIHLKNREVGIKKLIAAVKSL